jgi:hypothetical protein
VRDPPGTSVSASVSPGQTRTGQISEAVEAFDSVTRVTSSDRPELASRSSLM